MFCCVMYYVNKEWGVKNSTLIIIVVRHDQLFETQCHLRQTMFRRLIKVLNLTE